VKCAKLQDRTVNGFKVPLENALTENERQWIEILRIICNDDVPAPDYDLIVALRKVYSGEIAFPI
jgi:hypothetical protein